MKDKKMPDTHLLDWFFKGLAGVLGFFGVHLFNENRVLHKRINDTNKDIGEIKTYMAVNHPTKSDFKDEMKEIKDVLNGGLARMETSISNLTDKIDAKADK